MATPREGYRFVTGKNSGKTREVRIGSKADKPEATYTPTEKTSFTNTKGQKVQVLTDGTKLYDEQRVPIQTTTSNRKQAKDNMSKFDQKQYERAQYDQTKKTEAETAKANAPVVDPNKVTTVTDPYAGLDDNEAKFRKDADDRIARMNKTYADIERFADSSTRDLVNATKEIYNARIERTRASNERLLAMKNIGNMRQGRARYTTDLAQDILSDEEQQGADRIDEIRGEMLKTIAEANKARAGDKMKAFNDHFNNLQKIEEQLQQQISDNYDRAVQQDKLIMDREKEARIKEKEENDRLLETSKRSAPALAKKLAEFKTPEERTAFIDAYAEQTGIDADILMGDITGEMDDQQKRDLDIRNIENQIYNRNRSENRQQAKDARDAEKDEDDGMEVVKNLMSGATTLDDFTGEAKQKAILGLRETGFYSSEPPQWYIEMKNLETGQTVEPQFLKDEWETYRQGIIGGV